MWQCLIICKRQNLIFIHQVGGKVVRVGLNLNSLRLGKTKVRKRPLVFLLLGISTLTFAGSEPEFAGVISRELEDSTPDWPAANLPPEGSPNMLIWMIDDAGVGHIGAFGGVVETPNLDRLAEKGLRFSNFHATPVCSASRASLLTGRNPHRVHVGSHAGSSIGFPGYDAHIPASTGTLAHILKGRGYATYAIGKWDHLPTEDTSVGGPFDYWPSGQGFDRFYGYLAADTSNFEPTLWSDHSPVDFPRDQQDYHLSKDMADTAISWIAGRKSVPQAPPFMMYWATGAIHAPHHAPDEMLEYYRGRFDRGWDVMRDEILERQKSMGIIPAETQLSPRPDGMPSWDALSPNTKAVYARSMEALAAQMTYTDQQFGRILAYLEETGELDNTVVVVVSDNGASAEGALHGTFSEHMFFNGRQASVEENEKYLDVWGTKDTYPHVPMGWAVAGNTPFKYYKQTAYEGGTRVPMIISYPNGILKGGGVRSQFHFISDVVPTLLAIADIEAPESLNGVVQQSFDGTDMSYAFENKSEPSRRQIQYIEKVGNRAIYKGGWKAVNGHRVKTWELPEHLKLHDNWELYHIAEDVNELNNLASTHTDKLEELKQLFDEQAKANNVYPIGSSPGGLRKYMMARQEKGIQQRDGVYQFNAPVARIPEALAPRVSDAPYELSASINISEFQKSADVSGPIFAVGGAHGGISLYLSEGRVHYLYKNVDHSEAKFVSQKPLSSGTSTIGVQYRPTGNGAVAKISINGEEIGEVTIRGPLARMFSLDEYFDVGTDSGSSVAPEYAASPGLTAEIKNVTFKVK